MITTAAVAQDNMIEEGTIANSVGLCYYDPFEETIKEFDATSNIMAVNPYERILKKYYLVANDALSIVTIGLVNTESVATYSAKVIISEIKPNFELFDELTSFNTFKIANPQLGHLIPVWILLESLLPITTQTNMSITLDYE